MRQHNKRLQATVVALGMSVLLTACAAPDSIEPTPDPTQTATTPVFHGTLSEWADSVVSCLNDAGWSATVMDPEGPEGPGNYSVQGVGSAQMSAYQDAEKACQERIGMVDIVPHSEDEVKRIYLALVSQNDCVETNGFPAGEPPSFASYYAHFVDTGVLEWDPIGDLGADYYSPGLAACPRPALF